MKNILVLTGSARTNGNSDMMAEAFIKGASTAENYIMKYEAGKKDIKGCKGCDTCFSKGKACSFNDDFDELVPLLEKADAIIIATPIYWYSFPSELKGAIDKLYSFIIGSKTLNIQESMLLVCGETSEESDFEGITKSYERIAAIEGWANRGHLIVTGVNAKGDILSKKNLLDKIEQLGTEF
jgi:multimeric flavodoxin WrbA